jgi:hypothetical protein
MTAGSAGRRLAHSKSRRAVASAFFCIRAIVPQPGYHGVARAFQKFFIRRF